MKCRYRLKGLEFRTQASQTEMQMQAKRFGRHFSGNVYAHAYGGYRQRTDCSSTCSQTVVIYADNIKIRKRVAAAVKPQSANPGVQAQTGSHRFCAKYSDPSAMCAMRAIHYMRVPKSYRRPGAAKSLESTEKLECMHHSTQDNMRIMPLNAHAAMPGYASIVTKQDSFAPKLGLNAPPAEAKHTQGRRLRREA